jgi:hypothetical protein
MLDLGAGTQCSVGIQQRLLNDVLAPALGVEAARMSDQLRSVALDYLRERPGVAGPGEGDQPLIGLRAEEEIREPGTDACIDSARPLSLPGLDKCLALGRNESMDGPPVDDSESGATGRRDGGSS